MRGAVLYLADRIGACQAFAIIPGVSRSGITIAAGLFLGLRQEATAKFSFMLLASIAIGAGLLKAKDLVGMSNALSMYVVRFGRMQ